MHGLIETAVRFRSTTPANRRRAIAHGLLSGLSYGVAGFAVAGGVVLLLLARAVDRKQGWARSPAVVLQLLAVPVGIGFLQGGLWAAGVPVLLLAAATLWHLIRSAD